MKISSTSEINGREMNQDEQLIASKIIGNNKLLFCLVADGMGGTVDGRAAALITKKLMERWFENNIVDLLMEPDCLHAVKKSLTEALLDANEKAIIYSRERGVTTGSTAAIVIFFRNEYIVANVGDSRVYRFAPHKSVQITKDQTLAQREVDRGNLTLEEAKTDKRSHTLLQCIGMDEDLEPDFFRGPARKGDFFLICSDGMYNRVDIEELGKEIRKKGKGTKKKLIDLTILAKEKGEKDNITGILVEV